MLNNNEFFIKHSPGLYYIDQKAVPAIVAFVFRHVYNHPSLYNEEKLENALNKAGITATVLQTDHDTQENKRYLVSIAPECEWAITNPLPSSLKNVVAHNYKVMLSYATGHTSSQTSMWFMTKPYSPKRIVNQHNQIMNKLLSSSHKSDANIAYNSNYPSNNANDTNIIHYNNNQKIKFKKVDDENTIEGDAGASYLIPGEAIKYIYRATKFSPKKNISVEDNLKSALVGYGIKQSNESEIVNDGDDNYIVYIESNNVPDLMALEVGVNELYLSKHHHSNHQYSRRNASNHGGNHSILMPTQNQILSNPVFSAQLNNPTNWPNYANIALNLLTHQQPTTINNHITNHGIVNINNHSSNVGQNNNSFPSSNVNNNITNYGTVNINNHNSNSGQDKMDKPEWNPEWNNKDNIKLFEKIEKNLAKKQEEYTKLSLYALSKKVADNNSDEFFVYCEKTIGIMEKDKEKKKGKKRIDASEFIKHLKQKGIIGLNSSDGLKIGFFPNANQCHIDDHNNSQHQHLNFKRKRVSNPTPAAGHGKPKAEARSPQ